MDAITYAMSKKYTDSKVSVSTGLHREIVNSLPATGDNNTIYMVLDPNASSPDVYDEWLWVNGTYEHIGSTRVDLTDYYNKTQIDTALSGKANVATTLAGYGITDAYTKTETDTALSGKASTSDIPTTLASLSDDATHRLVSDTEKNTWNGKANTSDIPTTLSGLSDDSTHRLVTDTEKGTWNGKANTATSLSGYGITDAYTKTQVDTALNDVYKIMSENGAKNLIELPYTDSSGTVNNGITFTVVNNVVIKANGTATADAVFTINDFWSYGFNSEYILNCNGLNGANDTYYVSLDFMDEENHSVGTFITTGNDVNVTVPQNAVYAVLTINIKSGKKVSNKIFKPMIRPASDTDDVYKTPVKTNKELTDALNNMQKNKIVKSVNITSYGINRPYQCPEDGYIELNVPPGEYGFATIDGQVGVYAHEFFDGSNYTESGTSLFVRKGMLVRMESATSNEVTLTYYRIGTT